MIVKKRNELITPNDIDQTFKVHTGNDFKELKITTNHVGHKFGEFAQTKKIAI